MYNPKSLKAEEFISDEEIRETLAYADANKENVALIDQILAKAKECKGLTHREASVLLACPIPEKIQEMYDLAAEIKKEFYGNRIVLFAPHTAFVFKRNTFYFIPIIKNRYLSSFGRIKKTGPWNRT